MRGAYLFRISALFFLKNAKTGIARLYGVFIIAEKLICFQSGYVLHPINNA